MSFICYEKKNKCSHYTINYWPTYTKHDLLLKLKNSVGMPYKSKRQRIFYGSVELNSIEINFIGVILHLLGTHTIFMQKMIEKYSRGTRLLKNILKYIIPNLILNALMVENFIWLYCAFSVNMRVVLRYTDDFIYSLCPWENVKRVNYEKIIISNVLKVNSVKLFLTFSIYNNIMHFIDCGSKVLSP